MGQAVKAQGTSGEGVPGDDWAKFKKEATEASFKVVVQVRKDRVWVGTFFGPNDETSTVGNFETFPRPAGKTHQECVVRALSRAAKWAPSDFDAESVAVSDW